MMQKHSFKSLLFIILWFIGRISRRRNFLDYLHAIISSTSKSEESLNTCCVSKSCPELELIGMRCSRQPDSPCLCSPWSWTPPACTCCDTRTENTTRETQKDFQSNSNPITINKNNSAYLSAISSCIAPTVPVMSVHSFEFNA